LFILSINKTGYEGSNGVPNQIRVILLCYNCFRSSSVALDDFNIDILAQFADAPLPLPAGDAPPSMYWKFVAERVNADTEADPSYRASFSLLGVAPLSSP
jgi:hypothetical protein